MEGDGRKRDEEEYKTRRFCTGSVITMTISDRSISDLGKESEKFDCGCTSSAQESREFGWSRKF